MKIITNIDRLQSSNLFTEIRQLIDSAKVQVASTVNSAMTMMYWHIGDRINRELLGANVLHTASRLLHRYPDSLPSNMADANFQNETFGE